MLGNLHSFTQNSPVSFYFTCKYYSATTAITSKPSVAFQWAAATVVSSVKYQINMCT